MIDCREAVSRMWTYLDSALESHATEEFEDHLLVCRRCCGELEFSRHLRERVAESEGMPPMPAELRLRIDALLSRAEGGAGKTP